MNGQIDSKIKFGEWLETQDKKTQLDVLGKTRYEMFKKGMPIEQFVDNGKKLTLEELRKKDIIINIETKGRTLSLKSEGIVSRFVRNFSEKSHSNLAAYCSFSNSIFFHEESPR